jgi:iron complex transport system substrate-binding protein
MYQRTDLVAEMILDFHKLFSEDDPKDLKYIDRLE